MVHDERPPDGDDGDARRRVPVRGASGIADEVYSAWLAIRPGTVDGTIVRPSAQLPGVVTPVAFRIRSRRHVLESR